MTRRNDTAELLRLAREEGFDEGAEYAWRNTGEGWNGEYADGATHDGRYPFLQCNKDGNPYRANSEAGPQ